jgi:riboflavin synthase
MFTGIVEEIGVVERATEGAAGLELKVRCRYQDLVPGESIALNGACLTVRESGDGWFTVAAVATTVERTNLARWREGTAVNLERAMRLGDRLGGHLVQGHVDATATVRGVERRGSARLVDVAVPGDVAETVVPHGSIAIDGVSLTVNALPAPGVVQVSLIDYTAQHTTLGRLGPGDRVHVEGDVIGRYVRALLHAWRAPAREPEGGAPPPPSSLIPPPGE